MTATYLPAELSMRPHLRQEVSSSMASLHRMTELPIRSHNKEADWSSFCNNVFEQYLDDDDLFGLGNSQTRERSSSDDSVNLFDFSGSSEQSNHTAGTSPIPAWDSVAVSGAESLEAKQPRPQESENFWTKTLRAVVNIQGRAREKIRTCTCRS